MLRMTVLERGRIVRSDSDADSVEHGTPSRRVLPQRLYDRLYRSEGAREYRGKAAIFRWERGYCLIGPWVGVMQIPGLQLEILPKTDDEAADSGVVGDKAIEQTRDNLMEMLVRGGLGAVRSRGTADLALKRGNLHDQLVGAFLGRALEELRRGLDRHYLADEDNLATLRGKLVMARHVALNAAQRHRFYCRHDVLSEATPILICLKRACRLLVARSLPAALSVKCQLLLAILDDVPDAAVDRHTPRPIFNRQNDRFADIYGFARMLIDGQAPDARAGRVETFSLLFEMDQVFERYIAAILAAYVIPRIEGAALFPQAKGHRLSLFHDRAVESKGGVLHLAPDLLFTRGTQDDGTPRNLIIDTKWKRLESGRGARPGNGDLYQLYAYLHRYGCQRAFLLYPRTDDLAPRDLEALARRGDETIGTVGVRFVDLQKQLWTSAGREQLVGQLEVIVRDGLGAPLEAAVQGVAS